MNKLNDDKSNFQSFLRNTELHNNLINSSDRDAVLTSSTALDVLLGRLLATFMVQENSSKKLIEHMQFDRKIGFCYSLGLISEDEAYDLRQIKDVRNAFAHNLFKCSFADPDVKNHICNLRIARKANATPKNVGVRAFFTIGTLALENMINYRIEACQPRIKCQNMSINGK